ncbi:MAG: DUF262 domain-containing protein, partial [Spirochaetales bacterium]|nr:DUF262 domain-containing protein [Spirochaetales bacterium]
MDVSEDVISEYLTVRKVRFIIPVYQRNYDWKDEQCKQLWEDILTLSDSPDKKKTHFMGTICSKSINSHERTIIDGQQRITTLSLLVKAIHDFLDNEDDKKELDESYLHNTGKGVNPKDSVKLQLNKHDNAIYCKLLSIAHPSEKDFTDQELRSRICKNYFFFQNKLRGLNTKEVEDVWAAFDRLNIIDLEIGEENPQEIFESLNSTGLDLKDVDLLRNHLLMNLDYENQNRIYETYWSKIEDNIGTNNMDRFFVDYLIYIKQSDSLTEAGINRRQHINEQTLYRAFKGYFSEVKERSASKNSVEIVEALLKDMYDCSEIYKDLVFEEDIKPPKSGEKDPLKLIPWTIYSITNLNQDIAARSLLLYIIGKQRNGSIDLDQTLMMLRGCLSYVFRSRVSRYYGLTGQTAGNIIRRMDESDADPISAFWKAITSGTGKYAFPSDELFRNELQNRDIYLALRANGCRYLLYSLEQNYSNSKGVDDVYPWDSTTEHIMPQTLNDQWIEYLGDDAGRYLEFVHRLGNLALTDYNSELSNSDYDSKRKWFLTSKFAHTTDLYNIGAWG